MTDNAKPIICPLCEEAAGEWIESKETGDKCCTECALLCEDCGELFHPDDEGSVGGGTEHWCNECV